MLTLNYSRTKMREWKMNPRVMFGARANLNSDFGAVATTDKARWFGNTRIARESSVVRGLEVGSAK